MDDKRKERGDHVAAAVAKTASPVSPRIQRLRERAMATGGSWVQDAHPNPFERDVALYRTGKELSVVQTRAALLREVVEGATIRIYPDWRLAGEHLPQAFGFQDPKTREQIARLGELGISPDEASQVEARVQRFHDRQLYYGVGEASAEHKAGLSDDWYGSNVFIAHGWIENHSIRDYAKVLRLGFKGIRGEIEARMARTNMTDKDFPQRENFWKAGLWICDAGIALGRRYAEVAESMGKAEMA